MEASGFAGILIATRIVDPWGAYRTSVLLASLLFAGVAALALVIASRPKQGRKLKAGFGAILRQ
jgi:hypothetical protein